MGVDHLDDGWVGGCDVVICRASTAGSIPTGYESCGQLLKREGQQ